MPCQFAASSRLCSRGLVTRPPSLFFFLSFSLSPPPHHLRKMEYWQIKATSGATDGGGGPAVQRDRVRQKVSTTAVGCSKSHHPSPSPLQKSPSSKKKLRALSTDHVSPPPLSPTTTLYPPVCLPFSLFQLFRQAHTAGGRAVERVWTRLVRLERKVRPEVIAVPVH